LSPDELVDLARAARAAAYARYSDFAVGAAVLTAEGRVFTGCNVENVSYGLTMCAERVAIFKAVSEGERTILALAVVSGPGASMCGACRQVLAEFTATPRAPDADVYLARPEGNARHRRLAELLPEGLGPGSLPV
jgi:cytidine deaminase